MSKVQMTNRIPVEYHKRSDFSEVIWPRKDRGGEQ